MQSVSLLRHQFVPLAWSTPFSIPPQSLTAADTVLRCVCAAGRQSGAPPITNGRPASCSLDASGPQQPCSLILRGEAIGHVRRGQRKVRLLESALHAGTPRPLIAGEHISSAGEQSREKPLGPCRAPVPPGQRETQVNICPCPARQIEATREHRSPPFLPSSPLLCSFGHPHSHRFGLTARRG